MSRALYPICTIGLLLGGGGIDAAQEPKGRQQAFHQARSMAAASEVARSTEYLQELSEWLLTLRAETIRFAAELDQAREHRPIPGRSLEQLKLGTREHLAARDEVLAVIAPFRSWHRDSAQTSVLTPETRRKGVLIATSGGALLYDNFALAVALFESSGRTRRVINRADRAFGLGADELLDSIRRYYSPEDREDFRAAVRWLEQQAPALARQEGDDEQVRWLRALLRESRSARSIGKGNPVADYLDLLSSTPRQWLDLLDSTAIDSTQRAVSGLLGGSASEPHVHRGAFEASPEVVATVLQNLQPLDILLDKSRWRGAIDTLIPGYFTHVAIWLGTSSDLEREGVWNSPPVRTHHEAFSGDAGGRVLEAVRGGVRLTSLPVFLNLDDLVILRHRGLSPEQRRQALERAFAQVGKEYDFNFDAETTDRIVCSELPYLVFTTVDWRTSSLVGRNTISPDNVALAGLAGGPFQTVAVWIEGRPSMSSPEEALRRLLTSEASTSR